MTPDRDTRDPGTRLGDDVVVPLPARHASGPFGDLSADEPEPEPLPNRYEIRYVEDRRLLVCREAPGVGVSIDPDHAFSEIEARKLGKRTILLDGAGTFAPLIDDGRHLYNLDHHEGCPRAFTLATCEQALVMVLKRVELDKGDWTVYANQPDLDTVLAIWVLLNYRRVRRLGVEARDAIVPLIRLEGAIDANGYEIAEFCGLPQERVVAEKERLDGLFAKELAAKREGWAQVDLVQYTLDMLLEIDGMVFTSSDFSDYASVEREHGHVSIGGDKVAVVCRDSSGIYEVEKRLKKVWGDRLGLVALERAPNEYTLRLSAPLAGIALKDAYERLNLLDPAVDGRPPEKRWGGADDIGGSPRPDGTGLTPREIAKILKLTYQPVSPWQHVQRYASAVLWTLLLALACTLGLVARERWLEPPSPEVAPFLDLGLAGAISGLGAWLLTYRLSRGWTWLFGWRPPAGKGYLALMPLAMAAAMAGGVWAPPDVSPAAQTVAMAAAAGTLVSLALALWFPGLVHGLLVLEADVQTVGGKWFVSRPVWTAGALYGFVTWAGVHYGLSAGPPWSPEALPEELTVAVAGCIVGVALAMMRERSLSIWPAVVSLMAGIAARLLLGA